jgi:exosortase
LAVEFDTSVVRAAGIGSRRVAITSSLVTSAIAVVIFAPILYYMIRQWGAGPDYSHGFLIAPLALYLIWERRKKLARTPVEPSWWGLVPLVLGVLSLTIGRLGVEQMSMRVAFVLALIGLQVLLLGIPMSRVLAFPLCFLFLMVPLPQSLVNIVAFPLQLIAADLAVTTLHAFGLPVLREGNVLHLPQNTLFVKDACSGLHSLVALGTLGVLFAYFFRKSWFERILLVATTIPIAIVVNAFRVALTGVLTYVWGPQMAEGAIHMTEGFFTFGMAFALLMAEATLISYLLRLAARRRQSAA